MHVAMPLRPHRTLRPAVRRTPSIAFVAVALLALPMLSIGCSDDPVEVVFDSARKAGQEAGYAEGQAKGYEAGFDEGKTQGFERGRAEGRTSAALKWAPIGGAVGLLLGMLIVGAMRSEQLAEARKEKRRKAALEKAFGRLPPNLDTVARARLERILTVRQTLDDAVRDSTGPAAEELRLWLSTRLARVDETVVDLSALTSRLRTALRDAPSQSAEVVAERQAALDAESDPTLKAALAANINAQTRALAAQTRAETGMQRCALQLEAVESFLSHARMSVATAQGQVGDQLTELGAEVDGITRAARIARDELAAI